MYFNLLGLDEFRKVANTGIIFDINKMNDIKKFVKNIQLT